MRFAAILRNQRGLSLVQATFILVVLAVLGGYMVSLSAVQSRTAVGALQGARAYHAARSGLEWGMARAVGGNCENGSSFEVEGFSVAVTCLWEDVSEAGVTYRIYHLEALAESASWPSDSYVSRRLAAKITDAVP